MPDTSVTSVHSDMQQSHAYNGGKGEKLGRVSVTSDILAVESKVEERLREERFHRLDIRFDAANIALRNMKKSEGVLENSLIFLFLPVMGTPNIFVSQIFE